MTPDTELNEAIAAHLGTREPCHCGRSDCKEGMVPNYCGNLNACAEFERPMLYSQRKAYRAELQRVCSEGLSDGILVAMEECISATARQRSEAYCRWRKIGPFKEGA